MKAIFKAWKTGWKVIFRLWAFLILINICLLPFNLLGDAIDLSDESMSIKTMVAVIFTLSALIGIPILFYLINDKLRVIDLTSRPRTSNDKSVFQEKQKEKYLKELKKEENI